MKIAIIGVGGVGAMIAWRLAKAGHETVAFEQFRIDHDRGSSFGESRIVRKVYPDPFYAGLMRRSYELWDELMEDCNAPDLLVKSGGVFVGDSDHPQIQAARNALISSGADFEELAPAECSRRFPAFPLKENEIALFDPMMGYANASKTVRAATQAARRFSATILEETPVTKIEQNGAGFDLFTGTTRHTVDRILIAAGPWIDSVLSPLGLKLTVRVTRQPYLCLEPKLESRAEFEPGKFPIWIDAVSNAYGFPKLGNIPGVKIGMHDFGVETTPECVNRKLDESDRKAILAYAKSRFPGLSETVSYEKVCLYTTTENEDFIIDEIPGMKGAFFLSPCSGHGFKFTPLMGEIGLQLATASPSEFDLSRFKLSASAQTDQHGR